MITFTKGLVALKKYPGYFWHEDEKILYTMKVSGVLRPLRITPRTIYNGWPEDGYRISMKGVRRTIFPSRIERYLDRSDVVFIPMVED